MYRHYKPLRNRLREHRLFDILLTAHTLLQWAQFGRPLPRHLQTFRMNRNLPGRGVGLMEWEVDVLIREALLHAEVAGRRSAATWPEFADLGNRIKHIENAAWAERQDPQDDDIWWELYRISHRQFPWQTGVSHVTILRHFKVYDHEAMRPLLEAVHGMTPAEYFQIGLSLAGHFMDNPRINLPINNEINRVPAEVTERFEPAGRYQAGQFDLAPAWKPLEVVYVWTRGADADDILRVGIACGSNGFRNRYASYNRWLAGRFKPNDPTEQKKSQLFRQKLDDTCIVWARRVANKPSALREEAGLRIRLGPVLELDLMTPGWAKQELAAWRVARRALEIG